MSEEWVDMLRSRVEQLGSIAAVAREVGYSRSAISCAVADKYPAANTTRLAAAVIMTYARCECPYLGCEITSGECRRFRTRPIPQSWPNELRHWAACQGCAIGARLAQAEGVRRRESC